MRARPSRGEEILGTLYHKGDIVFREGERGDALYVIQSGAVQISRETRGRNRVVATLEHGDFFGEMAIVDDERRSATVTAIEETRLLPITRRSFRERVRSDPGVALHLLRTLCLRIERTRRETGVESCAAPRKSVRATPPFDPTGQSVVVLPAGDALFRQGDQGDSMFVIVEGLLEVRKEEDGENRAVARLGRGELVGEMAVLTGHRRTATVVALAPSKLVAIPREGFLERIRVEPDLASHVIRVLVLRLRGLLGQERGVESRSVRHRWPALLGGERPLRAAVVSLTTCGGCPAALIDDPAVFSGADTPPIEIVYCPMLMDERRLGRVDVAIVDGAVRSKEDLSRLEEIRKKARIMIALGTCAASGGIPALANRFDLEEVVSESFSRTRDAFGHYFAGTRDHEPAWLAERPALLRKAAGVGAFVKVDGYVSGCPPPTAPLARAIRELAAGPADRAADRISRKPVCSECPRAARKEPVDRFRDSPGPEFEPGACFASRGVLCLGFMTRGGCDAPCPKGGVPCWGCRGATEPVLRKIAEGDSLEGVALDGLAKFSKLHAEAIRPAMNRARGTGLGVSVIGGDFGAGRARLL